MAETKKRTKSSPISVRIVKNGPCIVSHGLSLDQVEIMTDDDGYALKYRMVRCDPVKGPFALCRCGKSRTPPFCDGAHATRRNKTVRDINPRAKTSYARMTKVFPGPVLTLLDAERLCAGAGFCSRKEGTWEAVRRSDEPKMRKMALQQVRDCCGGRLTLKETKSGRNPLPRVRPSISLVEDPGDGVSGPVWLKGNIRLIGPDGHVFEARDNVSLCRCGGSRFQPFCDGRHSSLRFRTVKRLRPK